jgi:hypothetical protein
MEMAGAISDGAVSVQKAWLQLDRQGHFGSLKTFQSYLKALDRQLNRILSFLQRQIFRCRTDSKIRDIFPDRKTRITKLTLMYALLDELKDALHRKGIYRHFLEDESISFLNHILFQEAKISLLRNTS